MTLLGRTNFLKIRSVFCKKSSVILFPPKPHDSDAKEAKKFECFFQVTILHFETAESRFYIKVWKTPI
jgi:hypothetical protein